MREYEVRYKLYPRSRQTRMEKVQAEGRFSAAVKLFCKYGKYPVRVVAVLPVWFPNSQKIFPKPIDS